MQRNRAAIAWVFGFACLAGAQSFPLPVHPTNAAAGKAFIAQTASLAQAKREEEIYSQIVIGNVPNFLRRLCPVTVTIVVEGKTNSGTIFVAPDYLAVGTDEDYFLTPLTPVTAQRIADQLGCTLPTPKMVDDIYSASEVKLAPAPLPPGPEMTTVPVFAEHNRSVRLQRAAHLPMHLPGALVAGHKKDVVISRNLANAPGKVAIYGWHRTNGTPIQMLYLGHTTAWVDYSHGIRLVQQKMIVNGETRTVAEVLADPNLAGLLSDEGIITNPRYPTNALPAEAARIDPTAHRSFAPAVGEFKPTGHFGERSVTFPYLPEVQVHINAPAEVDFEPDKPVRLNLYALPNGNTTGQTIGHTLEPGDDWHFDIQHIGAQTRFLRELITNRTVVVAYLEAGMKSWPAWRKQHGDAVALLDGTSFVSADGGTWGRSHAMLRDLGAQFPFTHRTNAGLETWLALDGRSQFLLKENPNRKILHTVQVERNGFIHAMLTGTPLEGRGYEYFGARAYAKWILTE